MKLLSQAFALLTRTRIVRWIRRQPSERRLMVGAPVLGLAVATGIIVMLGQQYNLSSKQAHLLSKPYASGAKITQTDKAFAYNKAKDNKKPAGQGATKEMVLAASKTDTTGKEPYQATVPKDLSDGITFANSGGDLSFKITPRQATRTGQLKNGYLVYPGGGASQHIYTFKRNGLKEDILLTSAPGDTATYAWDLGLGNSLEAKRMSDGSIGLYSADKALFGDIKVGDAKTQALIDKAKKKGAKTNLAFVIPRPFIIDAKGHKNYDIVTYSLAGNVLTLKASNLKKQQYPLTIDPSVVVTTSADFASGTDDGSIDYATADQITRHGTATPALSGWSPTSSMQITREGATLLGNNGYLYAIGGYSSYTATVEYAPISADGTVGTWAYTTSFTTARGAHGSAIYNGYLYIAGGIANAGAYQNDVQYALINSNGTLGAFTTNATSFAGARRNPGMVMANGYMYIAGGYNAGEYSSVQYAPISGSGSIGTFAATTALTGPRTDLGMAESNGFMYVVGGDNGTSSLSTVEYASIKGDGTLGAWTATTSLTSVRQESTTVIYNGYIYNVGGAGSSVQNDVYYAKLVPTGGVGTWRLTNRYYEAKDHPAVTIYNGFLYVAGGYMGGGYSARVQFAPLNSHGNITNLWQAGTDLTTGKYGTGTVAYNGYLYVLGGTPGGSLYYNHVQYAKLNADGSMGSWVSSPNLFTNGRGYLNVLLNNGYIYIMGGRGLFTFYNDVQFARINSDGSTGAWAATSSFTTGRTSMGAAIVGNYMFLLGGNPSVGTYSNSVQSALINANGTLGTWTSTTAFTTARGGLSAVASGNYLFVIGGHGGSYQSDVQSALVTGGSVGSWTTTTALPAGRFAHASVVHGGNIYVIGGSTSAGLQRGLLYAPVSGGSVGAWVSPGRGLMVAEDINSATVYNGYVYSVSGTGDTQLVQYAPIRASGKLGYSTTTQWNSSTSLMSSENGNVAMASNGYIYNVAGDSGSTTPQYAPINADGSIGTWSTTSSFTTARCKPGGVIANGYMYIMGGSNCSNTRYSDIQYAPVNPDGTLGTFTTTTALPSVREATSAIFYGGYLYTVGGRSASYLNTVDFAAVNSNGTLGSFTSTSAFSTARSGAVIGANNGFMYLVGGQAGNGNYYTNVDFAVINSNGTLGSWAATTALPAARGFATGGSYNGRIHVIGGQINSTEYNTMWSADLNSDGTVGIWETQANIAATRAEHGGVIANGYAYLLGGVGGGANDSVEYASVITPAATASYERLIDLSTNALTTTVSYSGLAMCGAVGLSYRTASSASDFSAPVTYGSLAPGQDVTINVSGTRYVLVKLRLDDAACGANSYITDVTANYTVEAPPPPVINLAGTQVAPTLRGFTSTFQSSTTPTITIPATTQGGDSLYIVTKGGWDPSATAPTGWSFVNRDTSTYWNYAIYQKTASGTLGTTSPEAGATVTMSYSGGTFDVQTAMYAVGGAVDAPTITSIRGFSNAAATLTVSGNYGDLLVYDGSVRANASTTMSLSRGTTDQTRTTDTNSGTVIGHESLTVPSISQTFTSSVIGAGNISREYFILQFGAPTAPTAAPTQSLTPTFELRGGHLGSAYMQYKIDVCSTSDCSVVVRTINQTASQTGWAGQDAQTGTAYNTNPSYLASTPASHTYQAPPLSYNTQYWWRGYSIDPGDSNIWSNPSAISAFNTNFTPAAPTLVAPIGGITNVSTAAQFKLYATDADSDYLQYKIEICSVSNCSTVVTTADQTASQAGWQSQSQQSSTAYSSEPTTGQTAIYQASGLTPSTQYWWRAYAIDPAGTNSFSAASVIETFTTNAGVDSKLKLMGGTRLRGGTRLGN